MKKKTYLLDDFRNILKERVPSRPDLVRRISEILNIEKESISRRLNGNVSFTVDELGKLAAEFDISIDSLLDKEHRRQWRRCILEQPLRETSLEPMAGRVEQFLDRYNEIGVENSEFGFLFTTLPINLFIGYPYLSRFILFKWGHYYIGSNDFYDYESWQTPERFLNIKERFAQRRFDDGKVICIWDDALIWMLCREIQHFHSMHILRRKHVDLIRDELHEMLSAHELSIRNDSETRGNNLDFQLYISNIHLGVNGWYHISEKGCMSFVHSNFIRTDISDNPETCMAIREWIISLRRISSLISGTGEKERYVFHKEQHKIVDLLLA